MRNLVGVLFVVFVVLRFVHGASINLTESSHVINDDITGAYAVGVDGEHAADIGANVETIINNAILTGANGGDVPLSSGSQQSGRGGNGLNFSFDAFSISTDLTVQGGVLRGGDGGNVTNQYTTYNVSGLSLITESLRGASGGHGFFAGDPLNGYYSAASSLTISDGSFFGGDGGVATNFASGVIYAEAGHGVFLNHLNEINIQDGLFSGGNPGTANGEGGASGYDAIFKDNAFINISGGTFTNNGVKIESVYFHDFGDSFGNYQPQTTTISGGLFSEVIVSSIDDDVFLSRYSDIDEITGRFTEYGYYGSNHVVITGGVIDNFIVNGTRGSYVEVSDETFINGLNVSGSGSNTVVATGTARLGDLTISGATKNNFSLAYTVSSSGRVTIHDGTTDVNAWGDDHFMDTVVLGGVLNFNNQDFNLLDGASLAVTGSDAGVNFMGDRATVKSGASLIVSAGSVEANELQVESGGSVRQTITSDGADSFAVSEIMSDSLMVDAGALWQLYNDGSFTDFNSVLGTDGFLLGASSGAITNNMLVSDVQLTGVGVDAFWLYGISDLHVVTNGAIQELYARYGIQNLAEALAAEGDMATLLGVMQPLVEGNTTVRDLMIELGSAELATAKISAGFLRTAEMANSLSGAQSVLADQIGLRTREHLRSYQLAGKTGPVGARGPSSWWDQSMSWLGNRVPEFSVRDSIRSMQERSPVIGSSGYSEKPPVQKAWISGSKDSPVPSDRLRSLSERSPDIKPGLALPARYQTWGRAYVADVDQESVDGFAGYDASVVGGVVGVDRRFDKAVLGLAGGLSETTVTGAIGNDGEATSLQGTAYASYFTDLFYLNAHVSYAVSDVETTGVEEFGYAADYDANNLSFFVGAGFGLKGFDDSVLFTPEVSLLSTRYARDGYTSSSSLKDTLGVADMEFDSYEQWSHQSEVGAAVSMVRVLDNARLQMAFQPELRVHWVHQFEPDMDAESYRFTGTAETLNARLQSREEDLIRLGAGVRFWNWDSQTTEFGLNLDHLTGGAYAEWMVSGHFIHRF